MKQESTYSLIQKVSKSQTSLLRDLSQFGLNPDEWQISPTPRRMATNRKPGESTNRNLVYFSRIGDEEIKLRATALESSTQTRILSLDLIVDL